MNTNRCSVTWAGWEFRCCVTTLWLFRARVDIVERGGAIVSEFDVADTEGQLVPAEEQISEAKLWYNLFYFFNAVLPVAKVAGVKMALHPHDPPISLLKGVGRILTSAAAFEKVWEKLPVESNSITFCHATFKIMGRRLKSYFRKMAATKPHCFPAPARCSRP